MKKTAQKLVFYDYECVLNDGKHRPFGVVVKEEGQACKRFSHEAFVDYALQSGKDTTFIGHNAAKYDSHFLKQEFIRRKIKTTDTVRGNTILQICVPDLKLRFIDSFRLIPISLRAFPATFGFSETIKGYFPYRFLDMERSILGYEGPMPEVEWFDFDRLKGKERQLAFAWYTEHQHDNINLHRMCWEYCEDDVKVLEQGCLRFRDMILEMTGGAFDPF
jgi:hypothetical protein